ncbi:4-hydroxy-tetrahydrodipicolinate reductase [Haloarcula sp. CBA1130]|uniref:4-hydroxy-tetrahydrodipicolinate reductase n=1 Tax=unclassified Haloarcula TaxID=2624677 RepID=UPI001245C6FB|nr:MULTISPECIES: 4-hydroxy-tetrahydrodipicolinate reductase [unclassified Haloarcula]KAA9398572.1 4-hydroxy-tetrahydrodipicolinate reductase [Haloarcula sp. CBA1129]KAA9403088.1 4-hydroxy-tetrahydrodipicolinate reductase [Haloarcula sp. CBA1130]
MTRVAVNGVTGQMGGAVIEAATDSEVVVGFATSDTDAVDGVPVVHPTDAAAALREYDVDVVIDFAVPEGTLAVVEACVETGVPMVVGTTGFDEDGMARLSAASEEIPLLKATNFSQGIQVLQRLVSEAVGTLDDYDLELMETHHNRKVDAPSGTANSILNVIQEERDVEPVYGREGHAPREDDEIGVFARRAGDIRGEHELVLAGNDEVLSLSHRAEDRGVFAAGALDAATWLVGRDAGWYEFGDVVDA